MSDFWKSVLTAFGMAAKDASPEELDAMVSSTASVLDAAPAEKAPAAVPEKQAEPVQDVMAERAPDGDGLGAKLDRVLELLAEALRKGEPGEKLHDEADLDAALKKLAGEEEGQGTAVVIPAGAAADSTPPLAAKDAAEVILRTMRPIVAAIEDKAVRAQVTDAVLSAVQDPGRLASIDAAAAASAKKAADQAAATSYEQRCADSQAAYAARNPHKRQETEG